MPLDLPANHLLILRATLADCLEGVRGDLETPEAVKDALHGLPSLFEGKRG